MKLTCKYCGESRTETGQLQIITEPCKCGNDKFWKNE